MASPDSDTRGSIFLAILRQGLPLALGMASHAMFNLVDLVLVGRLGEDAVAGVHVASTVNFLPMIIGNGISVATMSMMSRALGAGRGGQARALSSRSQVLMLALGLLLGAIGALTVVPLIELQGVTGGARAVGMHYLLVMNIGIVTMFALMQTTASMRALGEVAMPLALLVGSNVLNLILDVVLLFGWRAMAIPAFGAPGAAYASVIARGLAAGIGFWWLSRRDYPLRLSRFRWRWHKRDLSEVFWLGTPPAVQMLARGLTAIALTRVAVDLAGPSVVAALGVTMRLDTLVLFAAVGFASAATTVVGRNYGAGQPRRARAAARWAGLMAMVFAGLLVAAFVQWSRPILGLFIEDAGEDVVHAGTIYLAIAALGHPFASFCIAVTGGVNGAGRVAVPVLFDLVGYLGLLIPAVIVVASISHDPAIATIWWIFAGVNGVMALAYAIYLERGRWPIQ